MINPVRPDWYEYYLPLEGNTMFECGGKQNPDLIPGQNLTYKDWFVSLGYRHVSVDFDPRWADFNDDLRLPLLEKHGTFDMFTNIGTSEHIETNQLGFWRNVHEMTKVGGLYIHLTPYPGGDDWHRHGIWYPEEAFFPSFAALNGWEVEKIGVVGTIRQDRIKPHRNILARLRKVEDKPFAGIDESLIWFNPNGWNKPLNK